MRKPITNRHAMDLSRTLRCSALLLLLALGGCATRDRVPEAAPPIQVSEETWQQIDHDIAAGSLAASGPAQAFARSQMEHWRQLVTERAETDFIPWFSSYWTQQWLTARVAWYNLSSGETDDPPVSRLAVYLQEQYHDRVLAPVAREVDPATVIAQATKLYIQRLGGQLQPLPRRYGIPAAQFEQRLKTIPAIQLAPPPAHDASLYQIVFAERIDSLPAYTALVRQIRDAGVNAGAGLSKSRISPVARRVSEKLLDKLAISGGTSAASALVGGVAGTVLSIGAAGIGVLLHEAGRAEIEKELRATLNSSMDDMWHILVDDPNTGVTAGIRYLAGRIEKHPTRTYSPGSFTQPVEAEQAIQEVPLPDQPPAPDEVIDDEAPDDDQ